MNGVGRAGAKCMAKHRTQHKPLDYAKADSFLHCRHCLADFLAGEFGDGESPREALSYELSAYPLEVEPGMMERIFVAWCKRCGRSVWDSRHLRPR